MKRSLTVFLLLVAAACATTPAPAPAPKSASSQDGTSCETAIKIDAPNEDAGIKAEYRWIAEHYPGSRRGSQSLLQCNDKAADMIEFTDANGNKVTVFFDISGWFGKY